MTEERPTMETTAPKTETKAEPKSVDIDDFMKTLEKYSVSSAEDLGGKLDAATRYGQMANLLGQEREARRQLEERLVQMETSTQKRATTIDDAMTYGEHQPVDIEEVIGRALDKRLTAYQQKQEKVQEVQVKAWNKIRTDKNYPKVKEIWDDKIKDPNFLFEIQNGLKDPVEAYREIVDEYKDGLLRQSFETLQQLQKGGKVTPPHLESGETPPTNLVSEESDTLAGQVLGQARRKLEASRGKERGGFLSREDELAVADSIWKTPPGIPRKKGG